MDVAELIIAALRTERERLGSALVARNTQRGYAYDWAAFARWCGTMKLDALPATPDTLALYAASRLAAGRKTTTIERNIGAILQMQRIHKCPAPSTVEVRELLRGARRLKEEQVRQVRPLSLADLRAILQSRPATMRGVRDRAIVLIGFASALRSCNLAALQLADVEFTGAGAVLHIRREKQDQEARGRLIGLPCGKHTDTCAVAALHSWIERRGTAPGFLFVRLNGRPVSQPLQPERIGQIVQQCVREIGLADWREYSSHSLRSGFVTEAGEQGIGELLIASQTGHHDMATLRRYFRRRDVFRANALSQLDL